MYTIVPESQLVVAQLRQMVHSLWLAKTWLETRIASTSGPRTAPLCLTFALFTSIPPSYLPRTNKPVLLSHEHEKKKKYVIPCAEINRSFTPLVASSDGIQAVEHDKATNRLASHLSITWKRRYSTCVNFISARLAFAMVRAVSRSPTPYTPAIGWESGDGLCLYR